MTKMMIRRKINKDGSRATTFNNTNITAAIYTLYSCTYNYDKADVRLSFGKAVLSTKALHCCNDLDRDDLVMKTIAILKSAKVLHERNMNNEFTVEVTS